MKTRVADGVVEDCWDDEATSVEVEPIGVHISENAKIGRGCEFQNNVVIMDDVILGDKVQIGHNVVIYPGVRIGDGTSIQDNSVVGRPTIASIISTRKSPELSPLTIGKRCIIGANVVLYWGTVIKDDVMVADLASIREQCEIKEFAIIGRGVLIEYETVVGRHTKIQTGCHITGNMIIEDNVFFGAHVVTMNDKQMDRTNDNFVGPYIKRGAKIGSNSTLMAAITIGTESVVGAGAVVIEDIPDYKVAVGVPSKVVGSVREELLLKETEYSVP